MSTAPLPPGRLYEIAYRQKMVLYVLLAAIGVNILAVIARQQQAQADPAAPSPLGLLAGLLYFVALGFMVWSWYKLGTALDISPVLVIVSTLLLCLPCISIIALLVMTQKASKRLQAAGISVGLMGADLSKIPQDR